MTNKGIVNSTIEFLKKNAIFVLIIAVGVIVMWINNRFLYHSYDRLAILMYPLALFIIYFLYLLVKLVVWIYKIIRK